MNLGKYLFGIREEYFHAAEASERDDQIRSFNILTIMFFVLVGLAAGAGCVFGLVTFHSWGAALITAFLLGGFSFLLLLLVLFLNLTTRYKDLYETMIHMDPVFDKYRDRDLSGISDEEIQEIAQAHKMQLRASSVGPDLPTFHVSWIFVAATKVILILILSLVVSTGIEFFLFRGSINRTFDAMRSSPRLIALRNSAGQDSVQASALVHQARWTMEMLEEKKDQPFRLLRSYSVLLSLEVLQVGLGKWKLLIDLMVAVLYLVPLVLIRKSVRFAGGVFLREVALSDITTSLAFFLMAQRKVQQVRAAIEAGYSEASKKSQSGRHEG